MMWIRDEMFEPNKEDGLIQALSYEEMQSLALVQGLSGNEHSVDVTDQIADEGEDAQDRNRSATIIFSDTVPSEFSQLMRWRLLEAINLQKKRAAHHGLHTSPLRCRLDRRPGWSWNGVV
jgi:hypothetical protein